MQKTLRIVGVLLSLTLLVSIITLVKVVKPVQTRVGSVEQASEYHSNTISGGGTQTAVLKTTGGVLGSIVVPTATAGRIIIYDATTTDATKRATAATTSLSVVGRVDAATPAGTYTFDALSYNGLMYDMTVVSSSTITWR